MKITKDYKPKRESLSEDRLRKWVLELQSKGVPVSEICKITFSAEYRVQMIIEYPKKEYKEITPTKEHKYDISQRKKKELIELEKDLHERSHLFTDKELKSKGKLYAITIL